MPSHIAKKKIGGDKGLPVIRCSCGDEIMLVPNVKLMGEAIEAHVVKHLQKVKNPKEAKAKAKAECIRDDLIKQVLDLASKA